MIGPDRRGAATLCAILLIGGCASLTQPRLAASPTAASSAIAYFDWLRAAPAEDLEEELRRLERNEPPIDPVIRSVSLALLLSLSRSPAMDERRALELLDSTGNTADGEADPGSREYRQLGSLWRDVLEERSQRDRDARELAGELAQREEQARALQARIEALQRQIEALKSIEEQMNRREQTQGKGP